MDTNNKPHKELHNAANQYSREIGSLLQYEKKLLRRKQKLRNAKDPILFLTRASGIIEIYENVKEGEWNVPKLKEGQEKKIILGRQWQQELPYGSKKIRVYWCHEDFAFPHVWGKPNVYTGEYPEKIKTWLNDPQQLTDEPTGIPIILETAQVNSEAMRDRERKVLIAWERFTKGAKALNIKAWAKFLLWAAVAIAIVIVAYNMFVTGGGGGGGEAAVETVKNGTGIILGG